MDLVQFTLRSPLGFSEAMRQGQRDLASGQGGGSPCGLAEQRPWGGPGSADLDAEATGPVTWDDPRQDSIWTRYHSPEVAQTLRELDQPQGEGMKGKGRGGS